MSQKTDAEKALDEREKALDQREKELAAREKVAPKPVEDEDLTPTPTQAENDAAKLGLSAEQSAGYKNRAVKAD